MADVIRLAAKAPRQTRKTTNLDEPARILLFTGVRYEQVSVSVSLADKNHKPDEVKKH